MFNPGIVSLFEDEYAGHFAYDGLREKWPQINERTKVVPINDYQLNIVTRQPSSISERIRVAVSGWRNLKWRLFYGPTLAQLDDPDARIRYSHQLWSAIFKAPTYLIWRILGKVFRKSAWYNRGTEVTIKASSDPGIVTTIRLERFGVQLPRGYGDIGYHGDPYKYDLNVQSIVCGYYPPTDTFYVYKRR